MLDIFARDPGVLIVFVALVGGTLIAVTAILAAHWRAVRRSETEGALKRDMLDRGMSAEEIERVIKASSASPEPSAPAGMTEAISAREFELAEILAKEGKSGEEIERILRALKTPSQPTLARTERAVEDLG